MDYIAHTPPRKFPDTPPHLYSRHVKEVVEYGEALLSYLFSFSTIESSKKDKLQLMFRAVLMLHDAGKLDDENQRILRGEAVGKLPIDHLDAGVAIADLMQNELVAWIIKGHHSPGLPSKKKEKQFMRQLAIETGCTFPATSLRGWRYKRSIEQGLRLKEDFDRHIEIINRTNDFLKIYIARQQECSEKWPEIEMELPDNGLMVRLLLSCLVDADHGSAETYSCNITPPHFIPLQPFWDKRLATLNVYVSSLIKKSTGSNKMRNKLRTEFYQFCSFGDLFDTRLVMCSAPVGLGKTTSVMAYLLRKSFNDKSSRIIIISPFSNIIDQTVKTLRKAVVLEGENPEEIVAAHHHKAEFSNKDMRQYTVLWRAPIIVTTAVQFFETLASADPTKLRKLSGIVGSSIFIDESHACLPVHLLRISWLWLKKLAEEWNCNIVFSSGSMIEFWNDEFLIGEKQEKIPDIFSEDLQRIAGIAESSRVKFIKIENALCLNSIIQNVKEYALWNGLEIQLRPSCLVIMNTVQSAAYVAYYLSSDFQDLDNSLQDRKVLHLSTALAPKDRELILLEIERRQEYCEWNNRPWYLIATSCVEAGIDLDFSIGFRERCSITSFLQVAGRINRHGLRPIGLLYDFIIIPGNGLNKHPGFDESSIVFDELWNELISPNKSLTELSTKALRKEFSRFPKKEEKANELLKDELGMNFQEVDKGFQLIDSDTATVIIDKELVDSIKLGRDMSWHEIQKKSVQLWIYKIDQLCLKPVSVKDGIFSWIDTYEYDSNFLGIMGGLIKVDDLLNNKNGII